MLDRTVAPDFKQIDQISIKRAERYPIGENSELFVINSGTQPVIKLELILDSGKWNEVNPGAAFFTSKMLREGTSEYSSFEISEIFESLGGHLEIIPSLDYISITIYSLSRHLKSLLPVIRSIFTSPTFPAKEFETLKNIQIQTLRVNNEKNSFVATKKLREYIFGSDHPYGKILDEPDINSLKGTHLVNHFKDQLQDRPFTIVASGLLDQRSIEDIVEEFKKVPASISSGNLNHEIKPIDTSITIDKEESSQSSLRLGGLSIPMTHEDFPGLMVTNEILGGYFGSRLMKNIREDKGLTYGIYSSVSTLKHSSFFSISADVKKEFREDALKEILVEVRKLREELVESGELETVRNYMLGQIQAGINTPFALASKFKNVHFNGLDYGYYDALINTIRNINPSQIRDLANNYLDETKMIQVCVG